MPAPKDDELRLISGTDNNHRALFAKYSAASYFRRIVRSVIVANHTVFNGHTAIFNAEDSTAR